MIKFLSSARITVVCLFWLFVLTFWGTIAQGPQGLYLAQERFFNSFFFLAAGFIPVPGGQLVLWVLFVNLLCMTIERFIKYRRWSYVGILVIHFGLILYFVAAYMIFRASQESHVSFAEGEATNVSSSYHEWELAYWQEGDGREQKVSSVDVKDFKAGRPVPFAAGDFSLTVREFYHNCEAFAGNGRGSLGQGTLSASGITRFAAKPEAKEKEQNDPGGIFDLAFDGQSHLMALYGAEGKPTKVKIKGKDHSFILRHKRYPLPFTIRLDDFKAEFYPGTGMASNYESLVTVWTGNLSRQVRIYMNNPLVYKDYALYQSSYERTEAGQERSTLAVVKNSARYMPYVACLLVFAGLALHFLIQAFIAKAKR